MTSQSGRLVVPSSLGADYIAEGNALCVNDELGEGGSPEDILGDEQAEQQQQQQQHTMPHDLETAEPGTVVGVRNGVMSLSTNSAEFVTVVGAGTTQDSVVVKMSTPGPVGSWIVPSGDNDGYGVVGPAVHKHSFAKITSLGTSPDTVHAILKTSVHDACEKSEKTALLDPSPSPATVAEKPRPFLSFIFLVIFAVVASVIVFLQWLPSHSQDRYHLQCNTTAAVLCTAQHGEFDNRCHAVHSGIVDNTTLTRCCASHSAYSCFKQSFCGIKCDEVPDPRVEARVADPNDTLIAAGISSVLGILASNISVESYPQRNTTSIGFTQQMYYNSFMNEASKGGSELRDAIGMLEVPWVVASDGIVGTVLKDGFEGWLATTGCEVSTAFGNNCGGYSYCFYCSADISHLRQTVEVSLYPKTTLWVLSGSFAALSSSRPHHVTPNILLTFYPLSPLAPIVQETVQPEMIDPTATDTWWPKYLPFYWSGHVPAGTARMEVSLGCTGKTGLCSYYYSGVTLSPGEPPCSETDNCHHIKCTQLFNSTHSICLSSQTCRKQEDGELPYNLIGGNSDIDAYFVGGLFDEVKMTAGGALAGNFTANVTSAVERVMLYDMRKDMQQIPWACPTADLYCENLSFKNYSEFRYNLLFANEMNNIPPEFHSWRVMSSVVDSQDAPAVCVDIHWYAAKEPPHVMYIT
eukprot:TRINITY_DN5044_c0_g1_i1.p1 TRINITY_DN5044_c0_g1~~TRINITY_DN5044_c0_g1_i1.p1  ORF type:complete len:691 (+),score=101.88 TRINITY_DN5044_c0_g1_i1:52-2124(+)